MSFIDPKIVQKPWGSEQWLADGVRTPYALKKIFFKEGNRSSLQVHQYKHETNYVLDGTGILLLREKLFDVKSYLNSPEKSIFTTEINDGLLEILIKPGDVIDVKPGQIHRVIALTDLVFIEASSIELDDVIRLKDDTGRSHGKINSEHEG
jgi:mannose-6-phosphate isomerase-like protein (cupin superfamily)